MNAIAFDIELPPLNWSAPVEVATARGPRLLRKAAPSKRFWELWGAYKAELKEKGISVAKTKEDKWEVQWWSEPDEATKQARAQAIEESTAADSDLIIPMPDGLTLFPFQRAGVEFAMKRKRVLIADEMGLGKTVQAISIINCDSTIRRALIVCPANLKINWARELNRWLIPSLSIGIATARAWPDADIVIVNYDVVHKWRDKLSSTWDLVVLDEAQNCKNPGARRTQILLGHKGKGESWAGIRGRYMLALTGTPIENRPIEIQPIIAWLMPEARWCQRYPFAHRYCAAFHNGWGWDFSGASNLAELRERLRASVMIRRTKQQVLTELPAKRRQLIELDSDDDAVAAALQGERETLDWCRTAIENATIEMELAKTTEDSAFKEAAQNLKQARFYALNEIARVRHVTALAKVPAAVDFVRNLMESVGPKILVYAHHLDVIRQLAAAFPRAVILTGETSREDAQRAVDQFQNDPEVGPFIGGIRAAGVGITLTAASHVVFVEQDWTPGRMAQCEDRAHRIGQHAPVLCYYLVINDSIDAKIMHTLIGKLDTIQQALDGVEPESQSDDWVMSAIGIDRLEPTRRDEYLDAAAAITDQQIETIQRILRRQVESNAYADHVRLGVARRLAGLSSWTPAQAALGRRLCIESTQPPSPAELEIIQA